MTDKNNVKKVVKDFYRQVATQGNCCGCSCNGSHQENNKQIAKSIGYSEEELEKVGSANMGLGCGNPVALVSLKEGGVVVDLGSGGGLDCFLASERVGDSGKVIGIDMTEEMISLARKNAKKQGFVNVEFRLGDIEDLPIDDNFADVVISNCVVNLAPSKEKVFREAFRILKKGGRMYLSDIVLLKELSQEQRQNSALIAGCVGGAMLRNDYIRTIENVGFTVKILSEDKEISKRQYQGISLESLKIEAKKE